MIRRMQPCGVPSCWCARPDVPAPNEREAEYHRMIGGGESYAFSQAAAVAAVADIERRQGAAAVDVGAVDLDELADKITKNVIAGMTEGVFQISAEFAEWIAGNHPGGWNGTARLGGGGPYPGMFLRYTITTVGTLELALEAENGMTGWRGTLRGAPKPQNYRIT